LPQSFAIDKHEVRGPPPTILLTKSPNKQNFEQGDEIMVSGQVRKAELYNAAKNGESLDAKLTLRDEKNKIIFSDLMGIDIEGNYHYNLQTSKLSPGKYEFEINYGPAGTGDRITIEPNLKFWTPLKQFKSGISIEDIQCKEFLILVTKNDGSPACVKEQSISTLVERNWGTSDNWIKASNADRALNYETDTGKIISVHAFSEYKNPSLPGETQDTSLVIKINSENAGVFEITLPRDLIDSKINNSDDSFFVLLDGIEVEYKETKTENDRTLVFHLPDKTKTVEIIGYGYYNSDLPVPQTKETELIPEPERMSDAEMQLYDARISLQTAYQNHVNLGSYYMTDVIVGFGTYDDVLIIDIPSKYTDQDSIQAIKKEIRHIVGKQVKIDYAIYDEPIERHISTVIPYLWNKILHQKQIDFTPKEQAYWNNSDGFREHDRACSPLVASNGTEFYISSTFDLEPFEITGTFIDKTEPDDCHKIWKTDVIMQEPDRVTALWLENEN